MQLGDRECDLNGAAQPVPVQGGALAAARVQVRHVRAHPLAPLQPALLLREHERAQRRERGDDWQQARGRGRGGGRHRAVSRDQRTAVAALGRDVDDVLGARVQGVGAHRVVRVELAVGGEVEVEEVEMDDVGERSIVERVQHEAGGLDQQRRHVVWRADRALLEEVGVVTHLAQLHEHVHDADERAAAELGARLRVVHKVLVELALALRERAGHHVLDLGEQRLLNVLLEPAEQKRAQDRVEPRDQAFVDRLGALDHPGHRVGEPLLELAMRLEDMRHQKVQQRPELHKVVLQGCARQEQPAL